MTLVEFQNRVLVLFQWAWNYFTRNRSARLITGPNPLPFRAVDAPDSAVSEEAEEAEEAYQVSDR